VGAKVGQPDTGLELIDHQRLGRAQDHRLAAVGQIAQPRGPVDCRANVVAWVVPKRNYLLVSKDITPHPPPNYSSFAQAAQRLGVGDLWSFTMRDLAQLPGESARDHLRL
jgi:hypothetical protein